MKRAILSLTIAAALASPAAAQTYAIENATVHTEPGTAIEGATVVISNGTITAVGKGVRVPAGATEIDAEGKVVTAGFIEASTDIGLSEVNQVGHTIEGRFGGGDDAVYAAYRVTDGFNASSVTIPLARTGGVTATVATPRGGFVSGTSAFMALGDGTTAEMTVADPVAMYVNLGRGALESSHGSRGIAVLELRELLDDARTYRRNKARFERNQSRDFAAGRLDLEALVPVARGQLPLVVRAHRASDIRAALELRQQGVRIIIEGGTEAWTLARELAAANVPVILNPIANLPASFDRLHVRDDAANVLAGAGVTIAISTLGDAANARTLRQLAGNAIARGLPADAALAAVTTGPAAIFGIRDRGTIERGKAADLVIWSGDPFELSTRVERTFVGGEPQPLDTRQKRLFERYRTLPLR